MKPKTITGTIILEVLKWNRRDRKPVVTKTETRPCRRTPQRFVLERFGTQMQFDLEGKCVVGKAAGFAYIYRVLPHTFEEIRQ